MKDQGVKDQLKLYLTNSLKPQMAKLADQPSRASGFPVESGPPRPTGNSPSKEAIPNEYFCPISQEDWACRGNHGIDMKLCNEALEII